MFAGKSATTPKKSLEKQPHQRSLWKTPFPPCPICVVSSGREREWAPCVKPWGGPRKGLRARAAWGKTKAEMCVWAVEWVSRVFFKVCVYQEEEKEDI